MHLCQQNRLHLYFYPNREISRCLKVSDTNHSLMSIGISNLSSLAHHILQISPAEKRKLNLERGTEDEHETQIVPFTPRTSQSRPSDTSTDIERGPNRDLRTMAGHSKTNQKGANQKTEKIVQSWRNHQDRGPVIFNHELP